MEIRIKANTEQQKVLDGLGGNDKPSGNRSECCRRKKQRTCSFRTESGDSINKLRKHVEEFQRKLEGQNAVEIENNLQAMKPEKVNLIRKQLTRKRLWSDVRTRMPV